MSSIIVEKVTAERNRVVVEYSLAERLKTYFRSCMFEAEYEMNEESVDISSVPKSILVIPFVCNVLPIIWLTNATLELAELDYDFYHAIDEFKQGYVNMYQDCCFQGNVNVGTLVKNTVEHQDKSATFFSGGVDAYCTLLEHLSEKPYLIAMWGADIPYSDKMGWEVLYRQLAAKAKELQLPLYTVHSNCRDILNVAALEASFHQMLHDDWWSGAQNGIGLISHAALLSYLLGIKKLYIAASYCKEAYHTSASDPSIDNFVRFCGVQTIHDSFISRQQKIRTIIQKKCEENIPIHLHVCWVTTDGNNCCVCEKCNRTIMAFFAEAENPADYGFPSDLGVYRRCAKLCKTSLYYKEDLLPFWKDIQKAAVNNRKKIRKSGLEPYIRWIYTADFEKINRRLSRKETFNIVKSRLYKLLNR